MNNAKLLEQANEAYRAGNPIMGDAEYDKLEFELGLENSNAIGEKHSPELTVRHPFIMGSLSKVQVHREKDNTIDWDSILKQVNSYIGCNKVIITPKYDGCSFEVYVKNGKVISISSRGDGVWGRDICKFILRFIPSEYLYLNHREYTLRGEVLINKLTFDKKYSDKYVNTRAFVAGITGADWTNDIKECAKDLSVVIYDYRVNDVEWEEKCWTDLPDTNVLPSFYVKQEINDIHELESIYNKFDDYRKKCEYSLDGFVIKPVDRKGDFENARPKDCVAIKFLPMTATTVVESVSWELGKTCEYFPIVYYKEIKLDGKKCIKASGHNYGVLVDKGINVGAEITISMAGDIIPYIYKVNKPSEVKLQTPENTYVDGCHLMKRMSEEESRIEEFRNSCISLNVPGLGDSQINKIIECIKENCKGDEFFNITETEFPTSIFQLQPSDIEVYIGGKNGQKIAKEYQRILTNISLESIIETLNFRFCGKKLSKAVAKYLTTGKKEFDSMAEEGYSWSMDVNSNKYKKLLNILNFIGKDIHYYTTIVEQSNNQGITHIPIIMTGEPNNYISKAEFLNSHPEYEETTSWKKVQIVFTNSLESNTGKMKKARKKNIEIRIY